MGLRADQPEWPLPPLPPVKINRNHILTHRPVCPHRPQAQQNVLGDTHIVVVTMASTQITIKLTRRIDLERLWVRNLDECSVTACLCSTLSGLHVLFPCGTENTVSILSTWAIDFQVVPRAAEAHAPRGRGSLASDISIPG